MRHCFALSLAVLVAAVSLAAPVHAARSHTPTWAECTRHMAWQDITRVHVIDCTRYPMPKHTGQRVTGHTKTCTRRSPHVIVCVRFPEFYRRPVAPVAQPISGTARPMLVTYYLATGNPMANGIMPSVGWAACGYDLPLGARVMVPGVGTLTCGDRIGFDPWNHIDVFGVPLATGVRMVTILN